MRRFSNCDDGFFGVACFCAEGQASWPRAADRRCLRFELKVWTLQARWVLMCLDYCAGSTVHMLWLSHARAYRGMPSPCGCDRMCWDWPAREVKKGGRRKCRKSVVLSHVQRVVCLFECSGLLLVRSLFLVSFSCVCDSSDASPEDTSRLGNFNCTSVFSRKSKLFAKCGEQPSWQGFSY